MLVVGELCCSLAPESNCQETRMCKVSIEIVNLDCDRNIAKGADLRVSSLGSGSIQERGNYPLQIRRLDMLVNQGGQIPD